MRKSPDLTLNPLSRVSAPPFDASVLPPNASSSTTDPLSGGPIIPLHATLTPITLNSLSSGLPAQENEGAKQERDKATPWVGLHSLLKVLESSADIFGPLKSAIGGLRLCIDVFASASNGSTEYKELQTKLDILLGDLSRLLDETTSPTITASMKNLSIGIDEELRQVRRKAKRGVVQRHVEALEDVDEILECYRRIKGHLERLMLNANLSVWRIVDEQATELRLRQLLPTLSAVYNSAESEDLQRGPCTPGTREPEISQLLSWAHDKQAEDVYWINGMAGTGKTTIAYSLCNELDKEAKLGASFFCSRMIPECRNVKLILPAIAYQLARFSRPFRCALSRILEADPDAHTRMLKMQFENLLVKPLSLVKDTLPADLVVVIDALDECENENGVGQILDALFADHASFNLPVRFLLSSRPEPEIYSRMMSRVGQSFRARLVLHYLDTKTVNRDIGTYLQAELRDVPLAPPQLAALVKRCGVLFIYASTAARYIKDGLRLMEHEERLNMILGLSTPSVADTYYDIDALYTSILDAAFRSKHLNEFNRKITKKILDTVICAQEPMNVAQLAGLLSLKSGKQVDALLRPLSSVLNITQTNGLVTTLHASFPDFMLTRDRSCAYYCEVAENHERIARACFRVIDGNVPQFNLCGFKSSYTSDKQFDGLQERVDQVVSPELFYACRYWITHLELGNQHDLGESLHAFLSLRLLLWMEVLNIKSSIYMGPKIIQRAENWSRAHKCPNETIDLAHDAWRFVTMFTGHAVSQSTPHIYVSMLPFWPGSAPITKHYATRMRNAIEARGTAMTRRQLALLATWTFDSAVRSARISPDGSMVAFGVRSSVYMIDGSTGRTVLGPLNHTGTVWSVAFSPDGALISGSGDAKIQIWDAQSGQAVVKPLTGHTKAIDSVCFSPDGLHIVSGSADKTIRIWDIQTGQTVVGPLKGHTSWVPSVHYSPDGSCIVSGGYDKFVQMWDARSGKVIDGLFGKHSGIVRSVCFSHDGMLVASGSYDKSIRVRSARDGQMIAGPLEGHSSYVLSVGFTPDDKRVISGSEDHTIRLWDLGDKPTCIRILEGHTGPVTSVSFSFDGSCIISCSEDKTIRVWDPHGQTSDPGLLDGHTGVVTSVGFSPDSKQVVSGSYDRTIRIWDVQSGQMALGPLQGHTSLVTSVVFSPDGTRVASGSNDKTIRVWDARSGDLVINISQGKTFWIRSICFSHDSSHIASGSNDTTVQVWDLHGKNLVNGPLRGHTDSVLSVHFSPDGRRIVSGSYDKTVRVWDMQDSEALIEPLKGHSGGVHSVCFASDGSRIVSSSEDKTIRVWNAQSGQMILGPLKGHTDTVDSVCFSPDSTYIVSGSGDTTLRVWNAQSGVAIKGPLTGHTGPVNSTAFSAKGTHIASGSDDWTIRVWDVHCLLGMQELLDSHTLTNNPDSMTPIDLHQPWFLQEDGWVVDSQSGLLAWVPPDLHFRLIRPGDVHLISTKGFFRLSFDSASLGESWVECYQPPSY